MVEVEIDLELSEEEDEDEVYIQYDIATYPSDYTLSGICDMRKDGDIVIPSFQREYVWSIKQASLLIESFLMGLPVPPVFFYIDENNKNLVIDGQQRILSVSLFLEGYFGVETHGRRQIFRLKGLSKQSPYHNLQFKELSSNDQRKIKNSVLRAINVRQLSPKPESTSMYHIFERLNTGGTALKPQEIRNCVYRGQIVSELRTMNSNPIWRRILGKRELDRHRRDMELILRLCALYREWEGYEKPMKEYLNIFMDRNRKFTSNKLREFSDVFPKACKAILDTLGDKPFNVRGPLNTSVLDAVFLPVLENRGMVGRDFKSRFQTLIAMPDFENHIRVSTTDTATVH